MFVAASIALTVAPGTTAPEGSVTVPLIAPRKVCALAGTTKNKTDKSTTSNCFIIFFLSNARIFAGTVGLFVRHCTARHVVVSSVERHKSPKSASALFTLVGSLECEASGPSWNVPPGVGRNVPAIHWGVPNKANLATTGSMESKSGGSGCPTQILY